MINLSLKDISEAAKILFWGWCEMVVKVSLMFFAVVAFVAVAFGLMFVLVGVPLGIFNWLCRGGS